MNATPKAYRNQVLYSVYVRSHTPAGTFRALCQDLPRIKELGVDIIWLMPIHPIGVKAHKGSLGCPYAIADYRKVNPEYGSLEDFQQLVGEIHRLGMRCIIDVVYNHTSPDSWLAQNHPEWFYRRPDGSLGSRIGDWSDVADLDYSHPELWDYQIDTLKYWAGMVDGFRCDVAPLIPLEFWRRARAEVEAVRPGCFWLAESVEPGFITGVRSRGIPALSDSELYQVFDACYDYDIFPEYKAVLDGSLPLERYAESLNRQEFLYPDNYVKLRFLENHDQLRAGFLFPEEGRLENWTALLYFQKGMTMLYAGQERGCAHLPSLFDRDTVDWASGPDLSGQMARLSGLKRHPILTDSSYHARALPGGMLLVSHRREGRQLLGIFSLMGGCGPVAVPAPDGQYENLADGGRTEVRSGRVSCAGRPIIFECGAEN